MAVGISSLASVDGLGNMPCNTVNNNFNAAVDLDTLFGGYSKIGEGLAWTRHKAMGGEQANHTLKEPAGSCIMLSFHPAMPPHFATTFCLAALLQATPCATMR
jgi:hypothetical protein